MILYNVMGLSFPLACLRETVTHDKGNETSYTWACQSATLGALTSAAMRDLTGKEASPVKVRGM